MALNQLNVAAMEALGGRSTGDMHAPLNDDGYPLEEDVEDTGEGYEEMPMLGIDNSASYVMQHDSKVDAIPYNESSIISRE